MSTVDLIRKVLPRRLLVTARLQKIFFGDHGHTRRIDGMPVDGAGDFQPWLTYPLIEYLSGFDFSGKDVFEFGAGASTMFWASRARAVVSVEFDRGWYETLKNRVPPNVTLLHESDGHLYAQMPKTLLPRRFDVVVVDGAERYRSARSALEVVSPGGMIILDNAEWYPRTADMLSDAGLIEVRFSGFSPINAFTSTSSVFLSRDFSFPGTGKARLPPRGGRALPHGALDDGD
ncbi:class I SAM-dependent methyltransferase [Paraburkholderia kururiensis]|uniref:class I SAM-dependent methyltransferase n=1 Tax=Paraburkholderia kururiensis TaxID=984307 RepID=UPI00069461B8|nr:class I SAM-dependent methyltransferase [Paraburkholderia kururiensis]